MSIDQPCLLSFSPVCYASLTFELCHSAFGVGTSDLLCLSVYIQIVRPQNMQKLLTYTYNVCIFIAMDIIWDPKKTEINFNKHGIRFSDAEMVLYDPFAMILEEHFVAGEQRFVTLVLMRLVVSSQ